MLFSIVLLTFNSALASCAKPLLERRWDDLRTKHAWAAVPKGWKELGPAPADHAFNLRISLKQDGFEDLVTHLYEVSDPAHERYGKHLSKADVDALVAPHPYTVQLVEAWLTHHALEVVNSQKSEAGDWMKVPITVAQAEKMFDTKYSVYAHDNTDEQIVRTLSYSLPAILDGHIQTISPTTYFGTIQAMRATHHPSAVTPIEDDDAIEALASTDSLAAVPFSCSTRITPTCLKKLYRTNAYTPQATAQNIMGIVGYLGEFANTADLQTFFTKYLPNASGNTFQLVEVNGGQNNQSQPGGEANLDIQYTEAMTFPTKNIYYSTGGSPPFIADIGTPTDGNEPYLEWLDFILNQTSIPQTFSTSYGDDEQTVPLDYATTVCNLFAQLGARGSSLMFSSGDFGVGSSPCTSNDGTNTEKFLPAFPASCPFVTAVGGTVGILPETAVSFSGGGFSNYFARPSYQSAKVSKYLTGLGSTHKGLFNSSGRAYPDVAAQAQAFQTIVGGQISSADGTSAASPTFAGVISLLNDYSISIGKAPLGFLNPFLYSTGAAGLNDIKTGSNPGCATDGFFARPGWDPVTGLGTPNFVKLQAVVRNFGNRTEVSLRMQIWLALVAICYLLW